MGKIINPVQAKLGELIELKLEAIIKASRETVEHLDKEIEENIKEINRLQENIKKIKSAKEESYSNCNKKTNELKEIKKDLADPRFFGETSPKKAMSIVEKLVENPEDAKLFVQKGINAALNLETLEEEKIVEKINNKTPEKFNFFTVEENNKEDSELTKDVEKNPLEDFINSLGKQKSSSSSIKQENSVRDNNIIHFDQIQVSTPAPITTENKQPAPILDNFGSIFDFDPADTQKSDTEDVNVFKKIA